MNNVTTRGGESSVDNFSNDPYLINKNIKKNNEIDVSITQTRNPADINVSAHFPEMKIKMSNHEETNGEEREDKRKSISE